VLPTCNKFQDSFRKAVHCFRPAGGWAESGDATVDSVGAEETGIGAGWGRMGRRKKIGEIWKILDEILDVFCRFGIFGFWQIKIFVLFLF
jgi:hypothetical protein